MHDFTDRLTPTTLPFLHQLAFHLFYYHDIRRANTIISNSKSTDDRLYLYTKQRSIVIQPSIRDIFKPQSKTQIDECLSYFGLEKPYLLNIATWEPRKNIDLLVKTFISMKVKNLLPDHELILVGKKGWGFRELETLVNRHDFIHWLGYVSDYYLPSLYSGADLFVFPSLYEGFGMPVLEARACGTKVVTTDIPELREAGGEDTIYIQLAEESLTDAILQGLEQELDPLPLVSVGTWRDRAKILAQIVLNSKSLSIG